ncbi:hypothetical protein PILCRDRAFT_826231 [Piloderma croceum F 1598]|uniref:Uncharacterized protein n=1 Tax=Piloderma croceum (strain F 1598) TaxID=765440 RepID=A0A0C3AR87_PILCF|nr:hypothetical protein PILCRDRAFT_826231 [Piloderma croceum F 1598]
MDQMTGGRKVFDIVIKTPVNILSCRCTPEWTSLPRYNKLFDGDSAATPPSCPCIVESIPSVGQREFHARGFLDRMPSWKSTESISMVESSPVDPFNMRRGDSLYDLNTQFERLVSGQESEYGDAPPAYDAVGTSTAVW